MKDEIKRAETSPVVSYLAEDRLHVTLPLLVDYMLDIKNMLLDAQERAYKAGLEDWSDEFAAVLDMLMDVMPGPGARARAARVKDGMIKDVRALLKERIGGGQAV